MAAVGQDQDAERKNRIIQHLNRDHQDSLSLYLQHYKKLSSTAAAKPVALDITLDALSIQARGKAFSIAFSPPLKSWAEARERTVDMDRESRAALGISPFKLTTFDLPSKFQELLFYGVVISTAAVYLVRDSIVPGTWFYDSILTPWCPGGPERFVWATNRIFLTTVGIHLIEAAFLDRQKLRKYNVPRFSSLWWKWIVACLFEGLPTRARIEAQIKRKAVEAQNAKH